jgi:CubicO group peptidase (beta-lactamase class C family)
MRGSRDPIAALLAALAALALAIPAGASAAVHCPEPGGGDWQAVSPADAGMDAAKLQDAIVYGQRNQAFAIRVYRHGCRVGEDALAPVNRETRYQSWSMAKSATALVFGRAMTLGLVGPDDPLGSLLPQADRPHGAITLRHLLTMTSGLHWNGFRDYNIFMPDRIHEALTVPVEKRPGSYWEYSQSGPALLAETVETAVGEDFQSFAQEQLFGPIGIGPGEWSWQRDSAGHTQGFFGLHMSADDFGRLGELMRRGGVWGGRRLLSERFVSEALRPLAQNGCYGYLIWLNASKPCVGPRVQERPVQDTRMFPTLPADVYKYAGLFGQLVTVFPSQGIVVVRTGNEGGTFGGDSSWEEEMYRRVLGAITDEPVRFPPEAPDAGEVSREDVDRGFAESAEDQETINQGNSPPPLPPAGPARARATLVEPPEHPTRNGSAKLGLVCPPEWVSEMKKRCKGTAKLEGARGKRRYGIKAGRQKTFGFPLRDAFLRRLERRGEAEVTARVTNRDAAGGTPSVLEFVLERR